MTVQEILDKYSAHTGWDLYSQFDLVCEYVENQKSNQEFEDYIARKATEELQAKPH